MVESPLMDNTAPTPSQSLTLRATVRNQGTGAATATKLLYYRSSDATITTDDTEVGTDSVSGLSASGTSAESVSLTAPSSSGTYYYGACVESVSGETNTNNNCSTGVQVKVGAPDLVVESPLVDNTAPNAESVPYSSRDGSQPRHRGGCRDDVALLPLVRRDDFDQRYGCWHR